MPIWSAYFHHLHLFHLLSFTVSLSLNLEVHGLPLEGAQDKKCDGSLECFLLLTLTLTRLPYMEKVLGSSPMKFYQD